MDYLASLRSSINTQLYSSNHNYVLSALLLISLYAVTYSICHVFSSSLTVYYHLIKCKWFYRPTFAIKDSPANIVFLKSYRESFSEGSTIFNNSQVWIYPNRKLPILAATNTKLIEKLTSPSNPISSDFMTDFILTYTGYFRSSADLIDLLMIRFCCPANESQTLIQIRVVNLIKHWIHYRPQDFQGSPTLIRKIHLFSHFLRFYKHSVLAQSLEKLLEEAQVADHFCEDNQVLSAKKRFPSVFRVFRTALENLGEENSADDAFSTAVSLASEILLGKMTSKALACHITFVDAELFKMLQLTDFVPIQACERLISTADNDRDVFVRKICSEIGSISSNLKRKADRTNAFVDGLVAIIVFQKELKPRVLIIRRLIRTANHLFRMKNYDGLMQILATLRCASVSRLTVSWNYLQDKYPHVYSQFENLCHVMSQEGNFKTYRSLLLHKNAEDPCVPFIGTYLSDLTFIEDGNSALHYERVDRNRYLLKLIPWTKPRDQTMINFHKYSQIASVVREIQKHQEQCIYEFPVFNYMRHFVVSLALLAKGEDDNYEQSLKIQPRKSNQGSLSSP